MWMNVAHLTHELLPPDILRQQLTTPITVFITRTSLYFYLMTITSLIKSLLQRFSYHMNYLCGNRASQSINCVTKSYASKQFNNICSDISYLPSRLSQMKHIAISNGNYLTSHHYRPSVFPGVCQAGPAFLLFFLYFARCPPAVRKPLAHEPDSAISIHCFLGSCGISIFHVRVYLRVTQHVTKTAQPSLFNNTCTRDVPYAKAVPVTNSIESCTAAHLLQRFHFMDMKFTDVLRQCQPSMAVVEDNRLYYALVYKPLELS